MSNEPLREDEFFIGYASSVPPRTASNLQRWVAAMVAASLLAAAVLASSFRPAGTAIWSDEPQAIVGQLLEKPYPMLRVVDVNGRIERYLLVATGKHGAQPNIAGRDGQIVSVWGTTLARDGRRMIELADDPGPGRTKVIEPAAAVLPPVAASQLGSVTLTGEIVDPKCYLGAMKPGEGKVHKACAIRCIAGGIPPMLIAAEMARNPQLAAANSHYLLVDSTGGAVNTRVLPFVAEPVEITGTLEEVEGLRILHIGDEPSALRRVSR